jgi:hypothetical protein
LPYRPGEAAPAGYIYDERARRGPIIGGLITFAVPYSLSLLVAAQDSANKKTWLLVPGFGPWLTLLARDSSCDPNLPIHDCTEDGATRMVLVIDGMLQTAGVIMAATGLLNPLKRFIRSDWAPQVSLRPRLVGKTPALSLSGTF